MEVALHQGGDRDQAGDGHGHAQVQTWRWWIPKGEQIWKFEDSCQAQGDQIPGGYVGGKIKSDPEKIEEG